MSTQDHASERYALSFTTGGLLAREATLIAQEQLRLEDWSVTRAHVIGSNLLQARTMSSSIRLTWESIQRLSALNLSELEYLVEASPTERSHIMWVATCRRYAFIGEFAEEVLREHFLLMNPTLHRDDFERFWAGKSLWHPELEDVKQSSKEKLRQNLFRMMQEADLLTEDGTIVPAVLSQRIGDNLARRVPSDVRFFPTSIPTAFSREVPL